MANRPVMKCGHTAQAKSEGEYFCAICMCSEVADEQDILQEGREACCTYCMKRRDSNTQLPFFMYQPDMPYDKYYCGCKGWD